ncbi:MAG: hypothetical protein LIO53_06965 [Oscillospiraceae bacterium]|nr:hypothetical protein [Oscillospiraceae bacterium]
MAVLAKPGKRAFELEPSKAQEFLKKSKSSQSLKKLLERAERHERREKQE